MRANQGVLAGRQVAITGIGGFIGAALARRAQREGATVRGIDMSRQNLPSLRSEGIDALIGDMTRLQDIERLVRGADIVVNCAAIVGEDGDRQLFDRLNLHAPCAIAEACSAARVGEFVQLSSVMVYGFRYPKHVDEDGPRCGEGNPYCETKIASEDALASLLEGTSTRLTVIRPGDVYGPGSIPWVVRPLSLLKQRLFVLPDGGQGTFNHTYIDNLVDGILLAALREDAAPATFNITDGEATTFKSFYDELARWVGRRGVPTLPAALLKPAFAAVDRSCKRVGLPSPASPAAVDFINRPHPVSIQRAEQVLAYKARVPLHEGLDRTKAWLLKEGLLP